MFKQTGRSDFGVSTTKRFAVIACAIVAIASGSLTSGDAAADIIIKSKARCLEYGGTASPNVGDTKELYPWTCSTPVRDARCIKQLGERGFFDTDAGKCAMLSQEDYEQKLDWEEYYN